MSGHNAGPWSTGAGNAEVVYAGKGTGRFEIATVAGPTSVVPQRETFANAKLIAAAPALFDACSVAEAALEMFASSTCCDGDEDEVNHESKCKVGQALVALGAALKLARGGA